MFCHLGVCHALIPLEDTSNNVHPLFVMPGCAAGHVTAEFSVSQSIKKAAELRLSWNRRKVLTKISTCHNG